MTIALSLVAAGLVALVVGGDVLVRGAVALAEKAGVSALVIGVVIVGLGTSMPELVTSIEAALAGAPAIAWGNIAGSNIANSLLILGAAALVAPIAIVSRNRWRDPLVALGAKRDRAGAGGERCGIAPLGLALLACLAGYIAYCYREERLAQPASVHNAPFDRAQALELTDTHLHDLRNGWAKPILLTLVGLGVLIAGGRMLVLGAIDLARMAGLTETLIGLTIVAIGTSLPELVTSVIAARKGETEVAFGNVGIEYHNLLGDRRRDHAVRPRADPRRPASRRPRPRGYQRGDHPRLHPTRGVSRIPALALLAGYAAYLAYLVSNA